MNKIYRAGIIGLGFAGAADQVSGDKLGQKVENLDGTHLEAYQNHPRIELVCGSSRDAGRRERFEARTGAAVYSDWREMISTNSLDIVSVASYTPVHAEMTIECAKAGIPVIYCEKPIAQTTADAEGMLRACESAGSLLVINHNRRFNPNFRRLASLVAGGSLGRLISINTRWPAGRLGNIGTHIFDAVILLSGQVPEAVSGTLDTDERPDCRGNEFCDPGGWGLIRLSEGTMVTVDAGNFAPGPMTIELHGTKGHALIRGQDVSVTAGELREELPDSRRTESSMDTAVMEIVEWLDIRNTGIHTPGFSYNPAQALRVLETITAFHLSHSYSAAWIDLPLAGKQKYYVIRSG